MSQRIAIVLFNLGGPDTPDSVRPFLFNLFNDRSILRLPNPFRFLLASLISRRRAKPAGAIYAELGGGSPLLANTRAQAEALDAALAERLAPRDAQAKCFLAMRYWHPMAMETAAEVEAWKPDRVILLPLYPQYSTTTTASSARVWRQAARQVGLTAPERLICCYPWQDGFIQAVAALVRPAYEAAARHGTPRVLFSAHGLPEKIVKDGDPYQWQCERTNKALVDALGIDNLDWTGCYQSRVGPLQWIGPATEDEIKRAGADGVPLVVVPMAFVSEHSETLVELDIEYRELAAEHGVPAYHRVPTVDARAGFIGGLADLVDEALGLAESQGDGVAPMGGERLCPGDWRDCPCRAAAEKTEERAGEKAA